MKVIKFIALICVLLSMTIIMGHTNPEDNHDDRNITLRKSTMVERMQLHLDAVTSRDFVQLRSTLSPTKEFQLILPQSEVKYGVDAFLAYHKDWFGAGEWTFETEILHSEQGEKYGVATVEIIYREKLRDGVPYFNRMTVSYTLRKEQGEWYVIKDHASSVEKSTDKK